MIEIPMKAMTWGGFAFFGALQAAVYLLVYQGFSKGQLAVLNPIFASYSGFTALLSILVFGEAVTGHLMLALAVIFGGVFLLNVDIAALRERRLNFIRVPGFGDVAAATVLAALWTILWDQFVHGHDWLVYAAGMYFFMTVTLFIYAGVRRIGLRVTKPRVWPYLVLIGLCETIAYLAISWGYGATPYTSVVALLSGAFSLPTILLARLFLKERTTQLQALASAIIVGGIVLLNVG
jgi:drug/metabolite transporter (DMT)-like permease